MDHYRGSVSGGVADSDPERAVWPDRSGGERDAERGPVVGERLEVVGEREDDIRGSGRAWDLAVHRVDQQRRVHVQHQRLYTRLQCRQLQHLPACDPLQAEVHPQVQVEVAQREAVKVGRRGDVNQPAATECSSSVPSFTGYRKRLPAAAAQRRVQLGHGNAQPRIA